MSSSTTSRLLVFSRTTPRFNKAALIGGTISGLYGIVFIILLGIWILHRRRKRRNAGNEKGATDLSATYIGFDDYFADLTCPKTPRPSQHDSRYPTPLFPHRENSSEEPAMGVSETDPFWMFDGAYGELDRGSLYRHTGSGSGSSTEGQSSLYRQAPALHVPTDLFVSQMNAQYPEAVERVKTTQVSIPFFRPQIGQVTRSPGMSSRNLDIPAPQGNLLLPPIPIYPLIRKDSIDRIVGDIMERQVIPEKNWQNRARVGHTKVRVKSQRTVPSSHGKSLSVLSEKIFRGFRGESRG
jgi:hypothetical protein